MTKLEFILSAILWIIIGVWISYKRDWYKDDKEGSPIYIFLNIVLMPAALGSALNNQFINKKWD